MIPLEEELVALGYSRNKREALILHVGYGRLEAFEAILRGSARLSLLVGLSGRARREESLASGAARVRRGDWRE